MQKYRDPRELNHRRSSHQPTPPSTAPNRLSAMASWTHKRPTSAPKSAPSPRHGKFKDSLLPWFNDLAKRRHTFILTEGWRFFLYVLLSPLTHTLQILSLYKRACPYGQPQNTEVNLLETTVLEENETPASIELELVRVGH